MPNSMANRDKKKKSSNHVPANEASPLTVGKKDNRGIVHPPEEGVMAAKKFVEENKK